MVEFDDMIRLVDRNSLFVRRSIGKLSLCVKHTMPTPAIQTLQAHVAAWSWQIGHKACFRQYASDIVDKTWDTIGVRSFCGFYRVSRQ